MERPPTSQATAIRSLPRAFEFLKAMQAQGLERGEGYQGLRQGAGGGEAKRTAKQRTPRQNGHVCLLPLSSVQSGISRRSPRPA